MANASPEALCSFVLDGRMFALDVDLVTEVVTVESLVPVPRAPAHVLGLFNLRGTPMVAVDLFRALGVSGASAPRSLTVLVLKHGELAAAIAVDRVEEVLHFDRGRVTAAGGGEHPAVAYFFEPEGSPPITVLDRGYLLERLQPQSKPRAT